MKKRMFVAHVFNPQYMDDFRRSLKNVCDKLGFEPVYADDKLVNGHILKDKIFPDIERADICIFEISEIQKPNVFIELGFAQGRNRPSVIIMRNGMIPPSDLAGYDRVEYTSFVNLEEQLSKLLPTLKLETTEKTLNEETIYNMVYIPKSSHKVGTSEEKLQKLLNEYPGVWEKYFFGEYPEHIEVSGDFYIDKYQVTNLQYLHFVFSTGYGSKSPDFLKHLPREVITRQIPLSVELQNHPVVNVSYADAVEYANWCKKRLPTEIEWEFAARGIDAREFPWGNSWDSKKCNSSESGIKATLPVGSYELGKSVYGCYDMSGNAWDWTSSWYDGYPEIKPEYYNEKDMGQKYKVIRGGSHKWSIFDQRCAFRAIKKPEDVSDQTSFRCVKDL